MNEQYSGTVPERRQQFDKTVPERRILDAVQPLFTTNLPWNLEADAHQEVARGCNLADQINAQKVKAMFLDEMVMIRLNLREISGDISARSFQLCLETASDLLAFLETLVRHDILMQPQPDITLCADSTPAPKNDKALGNDDGRKVPGFPLVLDWVYTWMFHMEEPKSVEPGLTETVIVCPQEGTGAPAEYCGTPKYPKLERLGRLLEDSGIPACHEFIHVHQRLSDFQDGIRKAWHLNKCLANLQKTAPTKRFRPPAPQRIPRTKWENTTPWDLSSRLFQKLYNSICQNQDHKVKLQLNGFDMDSFVTLPIHFNLFLPSCPTKDHWQECHCRAISPRKLNSLSEDVKIIIDLCDDVQSLIQRHHLPTILAIHFEVVEPGHKYYLWHDPEHQAHTSRHNQHEGAMPTISLDHLIRRGLLTDIPDGGVFGMNDKAVLALSLARCFLHLWGTNWLKDPWTADNIHFLAQSDEIWNPHHPFLHCSLDNSTPPSSNQARLSLFSFARLLLEIETGRRIDVDPSTVTEDDFEDIILSILDARGDRFGRREYNAAVDGCFHVFALVNKQRNEAGGMADELNIMRKAIYDAIVEPLEQNFNLIPNPTKALYVKRLHLDRKAGTYGPATFQPPLQQRTRKGGSTDSTMFFDGETVRVADERIARAAEFFTSMDRFHAQFMQPRITKSNGLQPVKIAVLDTGIEVENSTLQGVLDNIRDLRKASGFRDWRKSPIRGTKSFVASPDGDKDLVGHGTHVAWLALKTAPHVHLYIARVSASKQFDDNTAVVKAIEWAMDQGVDIMVLSFGSAYVDKTVSDAIDRATSARPHPTLVFAAASNSGLNSRPTFPATHGKVIGVYSLDGYGNDNGGLNPSRQSGNIYFGTLGVGIEMLWNDKKEARSGSSYAAPIAAGIAANCLFWLEDMAKKELLSQDQHTWLRTVEGMRYMFRKQAMGSDGDRAGILSLAPWVLWRRDLTDVDVCTILKEGMPLFR
ncbi:hypothetical protein QBC41DRAFT_44083 [Cercophora samala]|uniref:Peptidase S8/S53 domain-containing protein n=1 Tax=Cercophora samala TaxID=330535 RepID=A0AA39YWD8_9PEZI|nr:hypothetical protein QBC41DRAFT_44083 [Cercophora samala]